MISIVTGTLNRRNILPGLIFNTVESNKNLELVIVDGGSTDGTIEYLENLKNPRIKLIKVGGRSSYPHFMNLGIKNATHEFICQWNDDVLLINDWNDVFSKLEKNDADAWLFSWQYIPLGKEKNKNYCDMQIWNLCNQKELDPRGQIVMNYGVYKKELFKKFGLFDTKFQFYYADGELSHRFYSCGAVFKNCNDIRVASIAEIAKTSIPPSHDQSEYYDFCRENHTKNIFQSHLDFL